VLTFVHASDFADDENVTTQEVVDAINAQLLGGRAEVLTTGRIRVRTSNFTEASSIEVLGGSANGVLGFDAGESLNQLTNIAYVKSQNSDRNGNPNALGFTLGPNQNLIMILDEDSANKTFSVNMDVKGTATAAGASSFSSPTLGAKYTSNDYFNDFLVYWLSGAAEGQVQMVTNYVGVTGVFSTADVFPNPLTGVPAPGDQFALVPRTAENVAKHLNDLNTTTYSIAGTAEVTGISGDFLQLATKQPGSSGKIFVTGGTANKLGVAIQTIPAGAPVSDVTVNSISGLSKGLMVAISVDGEVTTGDASVPYDTFIATNMITPLASYFDGMEIEFLNGANAGFKTTINTYNNVTGEIVLDDAAPNAIGLGDLFRVSRSAFIVNITGTTAPYTLELNDETNTPIDVSGFTAERDGTIRDRNGLNFENLQIEGIDGYKYFTGLIQKVQWTIDGLDTDPNNYQGIGAAGTQFEVLPPVLVKLRLIVNVTPEEGVSVSSISGSVSNAISEYINSLGVGDDVILSEIVAAAQSVAGVFDVEVTNFTENVVIADGELARIDAQDLIVG
jgi:hypothetical protein